MLCAIGNFSHQSAGDYIIEYMVNICVSCMHFLLCVVL